MSMGGDDHHIGVIVCISFNLKMCGDPSADIGGEPDRWMDTRIFIGIDELIFKRNVCSDDGEATVGFSQPVVEIDDQSLIEGLPLLFSRLKIGRASCRHRLSV